MDSHGQGVDLRAPATGQSYPFFALYHFNRIYKLETGTRVRLPVTEGLFRSRTEIGTYNSIVDQSTGQSTRVSYRNTYKIEYSARQIRPLSPVIE